MKPKLTRDHEAAEPGLAYMNRRQFQAVKAVAASVRSRMATHATTGCTQDLSAPTLCTAGRAGALGTAMIVLACGSLAILRAHHPGVAAAAVAILL